ncbi:SDR family NAD(P)-dependent oxidoreductase [soil metagenome]
MVAATASGGGVLEGQRVLVTGATSGIGRATALACVRAGAVVAGVGRRRERLDELSSDHGIHPVEGDVADMSAARGMVGRAVEALGGLDVLMNSAGIARPALIADADPQDWRAMVDVNVLGLLAVTQASIPHLLAAGPGASIVNISSMSGRRVPAATGGTYAATKFAVHAITESLRQELQPQGIRVTTIAPGFVATEIFDRMDDTPLGEHYRRQVRTVGITPEDVASAIVHALAAPASVTTVEIAMVPTSQDDARYSGGDDEEEEAD